MVGPLVCCVRRICWACKGDVLLLAAGCLKKSDKGWVLLARAESETAHIGSVFDDARYECQGGFGEGGS